MPFTKRLQSSSTLQLIGRVVAAQAPPRILMYAALNRMHYMMNTGNPRFLLERRYIERRDPWNYHSNPYERQKYEETLDIALQWSPSNTAALEIGCSVGVFTRMLAESFAHVTAVDICREALRLAATHTRAHHNVQFARRYAQSLNLGRRFDVIFCAEMLYYIPRAEIPGVCDQLDRHLAPNGKVIIVTGLSSSKHEDLIDERFERCFEKTVPHPRRPYRIAVLGRRRVANPVHSA
jgi:SAM-dependent methyltransferase